MSYANYRTISWLHNRNWEWTIIGLEYAHYAHRAMTTFGGRVSVRPSAFACSHCSLAGTCKVAFVSVRSRTKSWRTHPHISRDVERWRGKGISYREPRSVGGAPRSLGVRQSTWAPWVTVCSLAPNRLSAGPHISDAWSPEGSVETAHPLASQFGRPRSRFFYTQTPADTFFRLRFG